MDSITCRNVNAMGTSCIPGNAAAPIKMMSVPECCELFNLTDKRTENRRILPECDKHDEQNDKEPTECLLNSLEETFCKQIRVKTEEGMLFTNVSMLFVETVRPQNSKLCVSLEKKIMEFDATKCPGANVKTMVSDLRKTVTLMMRGNAHDSKHNVTIA